MKQSHKKLLLTLFIAVVFIGGFLFLTDKNSEHAQTKGESPQEVEEKDQTETITYENEDYIYVPDTKDIAYDEEEKVFYYENILNLFLNTEITDEQADELAGSVDGTIVGQLQGAINVLQLQVEEESFAGLNSLVAKYDHAELVKYAELSTPLNLTDFNEEDIDSVDTTKNNWWTEAINVYPAWDYIDENKDKKQDKFSDIKVAVLEVGKLSKKFKSIDPDIKDSVSEQFSVFGSTYKDNHATLVTKVIAAINKPEKIRGVAAGVADIHFTSMGGNVTKEVKMKDANGKKVKDEDGKVMTELQIISIIKSNLENGVKIFNHSWGFPPMSKKLWKETVNYESESEYEDYRTEDQDSNDKVSAQLIIAMNELLKNDDNDFLIVQSAGNGYSRAKGEDRSYSTGIDAKYTGSFANINEETYDKALELVDRDKLECELDEILDHIIVVGGAEKKSDGYQSPGWAGYGDAVDIVGPAEHLIIDDNEDYYGTSFSAPMVSGTVALIWANDLDLAAPQVKEILLEGSSHVKAWDRDGEKAIYPMLNVTESLALASSDFEKSLKVSEVDSKADSEADKPEIKEDKDLCTMLDGNETSERSTSHYDELIETYQTAISEKWEPDRLDEHNLGPVQYVPEPLPNNYGYEFIDINNDGIMEMIIGIDMEDNGPWIEEIYTLVEDIPVKIFEGGIRHGANIYCNGIISDYAVTSPGQGISVNLFYELAVNGVKKHELDETDVIYEVDKNPLKHFKDAYEENASEETYINLIENGESMSEQEVGSVIQKYDGIKVIEPPFKPFVEG